MCRAVALAICAAPYCLIDAGDYGLFGRKLRLQTRSANALAFVHCYDRYFTAAEVGDMEEVVFLVKGSSSDAYEITFIKDGSSLTALCTCPAGTFGNLCKHRVAILDGNTKADQAPKVIDWLVGTDVETALAELRAAEKSKEHTKDEIMALKKKVAKVMNT
jgi:hypothetical protein